MSLFVDKLMAWAALHSSGRRKRLPPSQPIVLGSLLRRDSERSGKPSLAETRRRFIKDASD
jgi:hypothetical protein